MSKYIAVIVIALTLAVSGGIGLASTRETPGAASPAVIPASEGVNPQDLSGVVAALEQRVRRVPRDDRAWADLGLAYFELAGQTFDSSLHAKAHEAIDQSLQLNPDDNVAALANGAAISASLHQFGPALDHAEAALALAPYDPTALAVRIDALTQLGRFDALMPAIRQADRRQPGVPIASRWSYAVELRGRLTRARAILMRATESASRAELAHLLSLAADIDRRHGRLDAARAKLDRALQAVPGDVDASVGLALLDTARGNPEAAVDRWQDIVTATPLPEHFLELGETLDHLGRVTEAQQAYRDSEAAVAALGRDGANIDLELALYLADHGDATEALRLARAEWARSHGIHAADGMAWALHATGSDTRALRFARLATRFNTQEAPLWIHRGIIEAALGLKEAARTHLEKGIAMDPGESPWQVDRARAALRELGRGQ